MDILLKLMICLIHITTKLVDKYSKYRLTFSIANMMPTKTTDVKPPAVPDSDAINEMITRNVR